MKNSFIPFLALVTSTIFSGCTKTEEKDSTSIISSIPFSEAKEFQLSDFVADQKYILLSTDNEALFKRVDKVIAKNGQYYFFDHLSRSGVLVFDAEGNFLREIGEYGEGPQQLKGISDIQVGENGDLSVLDNLNKSIVIYSPDGSWKEKVELPFMAGGFAKLDEKWALAINFDHQMNEWSEHPILGIYDDSMELDSLYFRYADGAFNSNIYYHAGIISTSENSFLYHRPPNDTINVFSSSGELKDRLVIDFGDKKLPAEVVNDFQTFNDYRARDASFNYIQTPALLVGNYIFGMIISTKNEIWTYVLKLDSKELFANKVNLAELKLKELIFPTANLNDEVVVSLIDPVTFSQETNPDAYPEHVREHLENEGSVLLLHYLKP